MDEQKYNTPREGEENQQPAGVQSGGQPAPKQRQTLKERTARIRKQADEKYEDKPLSRRQRRRQRMQEEGVEYYYDDAAASRRAGIGCLIAFLIALALVGGVLLYGWNWYKAETGGDHATATGTVQLTVGSGYGATSIGNLLEDNGLIGNSMVFRLYARYLTDENPSFKAGNFEVEAGMSYDELLEVLSNAEALPEEIEIRVADGVTLMKVASDFEESGLTTSDEFLAVANDLERFSDITFIAKVLEDFDGNVFHPAEGLIFPDTYKFYQGTDVEEIVRTLYQHMDAKFTEDVYNRLEELDMSVRELMTLASIVQAESGFESQNANVAGVFWNRLNDPTTFPSLDSDVTLRYVKQWMQWNIEEYADVPFGDILYEDAKAAVGEDKFYAYVTIQYDDPNARAGLPNGPIVSVTWAVVEATLYPAVHDYYFFVTDAYNEYYYATTSAEHDANVLLAAAEDARFEEEEANRRDDEALDDVNDDVWGGDGEEDEGDGEE